MTPDPPYRAFLEAIQDDGSDVYNTRESLVVAEAFDADAMAQQARMAGARYVCFPTMASLLIFHPSLYWVLS